MSGHSPQTSRLLTVIAVFLCICMSGIFTRSSALPSQISPSSDAETLVSEEISLTVTPVDIPQTTPTPSPKVTKAASKNKSKKSFKVSPEASEGNWTSSGSNWMFLVDGNPYTGWLTDTDGKRYYFDENGIMQTGWVKDGSNWYYMNGSGVMKTGWQKLADGNWYYFYEDGHMACNETVNIGGSNYTFNVPVSGCRKRTVGSRRTVPGITMQMAKKPPAGSNCLTEIGTISTATGKCRPVG